MNRITLHIGIGYRWYFAKVYVSNTKRNVEYGTSTFLFCVVFMGALSYSLCLSYIFGAYNGSII